jgi:regulator of replication initiation timing
MIAQPPIPAEPPPDIYELQRQIVSLKIDIVLAAAECKRLEIERDFLRNEVEKLRRQLNDKTTETQ